MKIEKRLESLLVTSPIRIPSCEINQDPALQNGQQLEFECVIQDSDMQWNKAHTLMDTGASAAGFVLSAFVEKHRLSVVKLTKMFEREDWLKSRWAGAYSLFLNAHGDK